MSITRNVQQIIAAREVRRRYTPYVIQNDTMRQMIADSFSYKEVIGTHQTTADWIRNKKHIFLKDVSVYSLVMKKRAKTFINAVTTFLAEDLDQQKMSIWKMLCIAAVQDETDYKVSEELAIKILEAAAEKSWEDMGAPDISCFPVVEDLITAIQCANAIFTHADEESAMLLEKIWREHLLPADLSETVKKAYIKKLFGTAHQGGFLYSLSTAYTQAFVVNSSFRIRPTIELQSNGLVQFTAHGQIIEITEGLPIYKIYNEDCSKCLAEKEQVVDEFGVERKINLYLFEPTIKHEIKMQGDKAELNIMFVKDYIYSDQAVAILCEVFPELKKVRRKVEMYLNLSDYANLYLENGHTHVEIERLFARFPELNDVISVKKEYFSLIPGHAEISAKGDKIFFYLGVHFNDYVADLIAREDEFQHSEKAFVYYLKLMYRLGNAAFLVEKSADKSHKTFVLNLLKKYYELAGVINIQLDDEDLGANKYRQAYKYFVDEGVFPGENKAHAAEWRLEEDVARSPSMLLAVLESIELYIIARSKVLAEKKESTSLSSNIVTFFVSEAERTRGLRRAEAAMYLLAAVPTPFSKRVIIYCVLANTDGVELKKSITDTVKTLTPEILKRVIAKDLKALNIPDYDFNRLENEIILPLINKIGTMQPDESNRHETVFADWINALMAFNQTDSLNRRTLSKGLLSPPIR